MKLGGIKKKKRLSDFRPSLDWGVFGEMLLKKMRSWGWCFQGRISSYGIIPETVRGTRGLTKFRSRSVQRFFLGGEAVVGRDAGNWQSVWEKTPSFTQLVGGAGMTHQYPTALCGA